MAPNTTRNAGRQLLITRNRLKTETDTSKMTLLRRREADLLLELGQKDHAVAVATSLAEANPEGSSDRAYLADVLARACYWKIAEEEFTLAHSLCMAAGKQQKAFSLAAGPLFLLAESRGDYSRCMNVAPLDILRNRALRQMGEKPEKTSLPLQSPWREIAILEMVLSGGNPHVLSGLLAGWKCGEAEWRWRIVFEGAQASIEAGLSIKPWKKYMKQTGTRILDPRYFIERRDLKNLLAGRRS
ncbi:MAG: hypothetical protein GY852_05985 [bacterium]|nr:hypothetical protein [bacterium]